MQSLRNDESYEELRGLRARMLSNLCLVSALAVGLSLLLQIVFRPPLNTLPPAARWVLALQAAGLAGAAWQAKIGHVRRAALIASVFGALPPVALSFFFGFPSHVTLAAFIGSLLVLALAAEPPELIAATILFTALALLDYLARPPAQYAAHGLAATFVLVGGTGILLLFAHRIAHQSFRSLQSSQYRFRRMSFIDPLTGLGNRRQFDISLKQAIEMSHPDNPAALILIDVDQLKEINDTLGHPTGDQALKAVAEAIGRSTRATDIGARIGGDEFAIILPQGGEQGAQRIVERIREQLTGIQLGEGQPVGLSISLGYALLTDPSMDPTEALIAADRVLYSGKDHARKPVRWESTPSGD